jgi:hypothetical protein
LNPKDKDGTRDSSSSREKDWLSQFKKPFQNTFSLRPGPRLELMDSERFSPSKTEQNFNLGLGDGDSTASPSSWRHCNRWLTRCIKYHDTCNTSISIYKILPTRLIDVGSEKSLPRLVNSADIRGIKDSSKLQYVTLSHCWGSGKLPVTLNAETYPIFRRGIAIEQLTKTFQDAITVTRRLRSDFGIGYLWIDALCILQDSAEDWRREAALMGDIYGNSWCNLAAVDGHDGQAGLFSRRDSRLIQPVIVKMIGHKSIEQVRTWWQTSLKSISWSSRELQSPPLDREWLVVDNEGWRYIDSSPLNQRGWVSQERFLSPRILHFAKDQIYWECQQSRASETFTETEIELWHGNKKHEVASCNRSILRSPKLSLITLEVAIREWTRFVEHYVKGRLTQSEDKLPAFAGLARRFQQHFQGSQYLAGMWHLELERQLLWKPSGGHLSGRGEGPIDVLSLPEKYRAPSWSWASIDGVIYIGWERCREASSNYEVIARIVDAKVTAIGGDPFGQIKDGFLRLQGRLFACLLRKRERVDSESYSYPMEAIFHKESGDLDSGLDSFLPSSDIQFLPDVDHQYSKLDSSIKLCCMPIQREMGVYGLVLDRTGPEKGQYRRVGTFDVQRSWPKKLHIQQHPISEGLVESDYEVFDGVDQYTVCIV